MTQPSASNYMTATPPDPGRLLRSYMVRAGITQDELAGHIGVSRLTVNHLTQNKRCITAQMSLRLGKAFGTSAAMWMSVQVLRDLAIARLKIDGELRHIAELKLSRPGQLRSPSRP